MLSPCLKCTACGHEQTTSESLLYPASLVTCSVVAGEGRQDFCVHLAVKRGRHILVRLQSASCQAGREVLEQGYQLFRGGPRNFFPILVFTPQDQIFLAHELHSDVERTDTSTSHRERGRSMMMKISIATITFPFGETLRGRGLPSRL